MELKNETELMRRRCRRTRWRRRRMRKQYQTEYSDLSWWSAGACCVFSCCKWKPDFFHTVMKNLFLLCDRGWVCSANEAFVSQPEERSSNSSRRQAGSAFGLKRAHGNTQTQQRDNEKNDSNYTVASARTGQRYRTPYMNDLWCFNVTFCLYHLDFIKKTNSGNKKNRSWYRHCLGEYI